MVVLLFSISVLWSVDRTSCELFLEGLTTEESVQCSDTMVMRALLVLGFLARTELC